MSEPSLQANNFLNQLTAKVEENIADERFGVSALAEAMNMSRSNLLRKVKKETKLSVSQLIRQVRLQQAMSLLRSSALNVSEVSVRVGFSSTSYFIKCFREYYSYPPGEVGKRNEMEIPVPEKRSRNQKLIIAGATGLAFIIITTLTAYFYFPKPAPKPIEKSIAVLPFKNDSSDSSNIYLINGLMESTLNNLQKIKDLRVISRTSTEQYRNATKSVKEMAGELNVSYFVEGSGQKIGNRILLNIQLIDASSDTHLWAKQYRREANDIFELQQEVAKNIAEEIEVIITPEEKKNIQKRPTDNLVAYDFFLKGRHLSNQGTQEGLKKSIIYFKKAIEQDNEFALAYASAAMVYFYLDLYQAEKKYDAEITAYAEKAILFDPKLPESSIAKALSFMKDQKFNEALPYLEKALEYNPNSGTALHFLAEFYYAHRPNTSKYLEYALMKAKVDIASDSLTKSYNYLQLSNAFLQAGFFDEAQLYIDKSLANNLENPISRYFKAFVGFVVNTNPELTRQQLINALKKDTTQFALIQEIGKMSYLMRDYKTAYKYYKKFIAIKKQQHLDIYRHENLKIGIVLAKAGYQSQSEAYIKDYKEYADQDQSIYRHINLATYYAYMNNKEKAIEHLKLFTKEDNYACWALYTAMDPAFDTIKRLPEFKQVTRDIATKFWNTHKAVQERLKEKGLL